MKVMTLDTQSQISNDLNFLSSAAGMFSYGFEVEPMDSTRPRDLSSGMSFGVRHHRLDDGTQHFSYAIGSGPLPESVFHGFGPSAGTTPQPAVSAPSSTEAPTLYRSSSEAPTLTVRPSAPSAPGVSPGVFQATGGSFPPVYVRQNHHQQQQPPQLDPLDGQLLLGSQKIHQVVPFHGDFGKRLSRRLQPDESVSQWRDQTQTGGFQQRQQVDYRQQEQQQQQQPALYPSEELQEPKVQPSEQQEDPPVTTYRPSDRPTLATAAVEDPVSAPGVDFSPTAPSAPIHVTQVAAAAQPVAEFRSADGSNPLRGRDPRFQSGLFSGQDPRFQSGAPGPLHPGVFPPGVGGGASFGFGQQGPTFRGNFPTGPTQGFNDFPRNDFFGNVNPGPQNNAFFGNNFQSNSGQNFVNRNNQLVGFDNNIRTSDQFQATDNYPEDSFDQFSGLQQVSNEPSSNASPLLQNDGSNRPKSLSSFH